MRHLEQKSKRRRVRNTIQHYVLGTIAVSGVLSVALIAPNVLVAMQKVGLVPKKRIKESIEIAQKSLLKNGLIAWKNGGVHLTKKGEYFLALYQAKTGLRKKPRWDKKWRVLIFDIPEKKRQYRDRVRLSLREYGFIKLQESVWVYPFPCEEFIALLKTEYRMGKEMLYMIVDDIENDQSIRKHFFDHS